mmetsp:Transcript_16861/g.40705  ORF Transcript_16861/g.40705 Transcript_16861/m.40705 type:complete len:134 (+) Transcript_16861:673-1074(+)
MSDTALSCVTPSGSGGEARVIITATSQVQTVTNVLTFDAFSLSCTAPSNLAMGAAPTLTLGAVDTLGLVNLTAFDLSSPLWISGDAFGVLSSSVSASNRSTSVTHETVTTPFQGQTVPAVARQQQQQRQAVAA